jgi:hypothetical protein
LSTVGGYALFWSKLQVLIDSWFLGAFANPVIIGFALVGVAVYFQRKTSFRRLLISWTIVATLVAIWVSPIGRTMDQWLVWRPLYLIPFQVLAASGLYFVISKLQSLTRSRSDIELGEGEIAKGRLSAVFTMHAHSTAALFLVLEYSLSALLLIFGFPILGVLLVLDLPIVAIIIHFGVENKRNVTTLAFLLTMLIMLMMFNYALRTLAPLTVHRLQF